MGMILGLMCEKLTGHRMGPWTPIGLTGVDSRFNHAQCRWCRQWYVRPQPYTVPDWLRDATKIQSKPERFDSLRQRGL